jgi:hypothetical protein
MRHAWIGICLLAACGGNGAEENTYAWPYRDLGELEEAIDAAADGTDTDGDSIPDEIERELGTDPLRRDSDFDGLEDNHELFEAGFARSDPLPDRDGDGLLASADDDEDGDRINDGVRVDTDGDGVPNFLEYYGYTYDLLTGEFKLWNGDPDVPHYFTDPLQPSTDQDAYPDGMEVSGLLLDPTIRAPGNDPLVPAYPNLVVELVSYSVTLNEEVQLTETESLDRGRTWSRQTERSHSTTRELDWGVGVEVGYEAGTDGGKTTGKVSANLGGSYASTNSISVSTGTGESVTTSQGWSVARTSNPTEAAVVKLFVKVKNRGTAPISNIRPTLTLKIGGLNVATFEPGNSQVHMLVPGGEYPEEPGVYWVIDSIADGGPLTLTMSELRALERGAPVSVSLTQVGGDAMRLTSDATWESVGATSEFVARCDAVCANLRIDLGDGTLVHHLVYAGDGAGSQAVTLGEALARIGVDAEGTLTYHDDAGTVRTQTLDGFKFAIDAPTLRENGWTVEDDGSSTAPEGSTLYELALRTDSNVYIRAPRDVAEAPEPTVHFAYLDPHSGEIKVSAADYEGVLSVLVYHEDMSASTELDEDTPGAGFYSGMAREEDGFITGALLLADVTNLAGFTRTVELGTLFEDPEPKNPEILAMTMDLDLDRVYANVKSGNENNANSDIEWIRVYHKDLPDGFLDMERVVNYYEDPYGFEAELPPGFEQTDNVKVVAYVAQDVWTEEIIPQDAISVSEIVQVGTRTMESSAARGPPLVSVMSWFDWDRAKNSSPYSWERRVTIGNPSLKGPPADMMLRVNADTALIARFPAFMYFNAQWVRKGSGVGAYQDLNKGLIQQESFTEGPPLEVNQTGGLERNGVYVIRTTGNGDHGPRYGKIWVREIDSSYNYFLARKQWRVTISYTFYK